MIANYLPIFKAKKGEFDAISKVTEAQSLRILPLFDVCQISKNDGTAKRFTDRELRCSYLKEIAQNIAKLRKGKEVMVDAFYWDAGSMTETGEHVLPYIWGMLGSLGVRVIPVIGYDRWDSSVYQLALQGFEVPSDGYYCLRLDSSAIEDAKDPAFFGERVLEILDGLTIEPTRCIALLDFGDVSALSNSIQDLVAQAERVMQIIEPMGFMSYSTAGCSLATSIDKVVPKKDSTAMVIRKETLLWQAMRVSYPNAKWLFGDYGVRGPNPAVDVIAPHMNGKFRHTTGGNYYIARGHSLREGDRFEQMYRLAMMIVESPHYMGPDFSWGDAQILAYSNGNDGHPGNSTTWIAIDTNHHLAFVVAEVEEFELRVSAIRAIA